jgi:hypothetical protein
MQPTPSVVRHVWVVIYPTNACDVLFSAPPDGALTLREFVRLTRENRAVDPRIDARLNAYLAQEQGWLIEDFKKLPPDIVLIDNLRDGWDEWARADSELTRLLKPYMLVRSIEGIDILRRAM